MTLKTERKFRLRALPDLSVLGHGVSISQEYLVCASCDLRVLKIGGTFLITAKSISDTAVSRVEWEAEIPHWTHALLTSTDTVPLRKIRYVVPADNYLLLVDRYMEPLDGLVMLECEFPSDKEALALPSWVGEYVEVTGKSTYSNRSLSKCSRVPDWPDEELCVTTEKT